MFSESIIMRVDLSGAKFPVIQKWRSWVVSPAALGPEKQSKGRNEGGEGTQQAGSSEVNAWCRTALSLAGSPWSPAPRASKSQ